MKLKKTALALVALGSLFTAQSLRADLVANGDFSDTTSFNGTKDTVTNAGLVSWTDYLPNDNLSSEAYLVAPGHAEATPVAAADPGSFTGIGNMVEFTNYGSIYSDQFTVHQGATYQVSYWEAMSKIDSYGGSGPMEGFFVTYINGTNGGGTFQELDPSNTDVMNSADTTTVGWTYHTISFVADSTNALLYFQGVDNKFDRSAVFLADVSIVETPLPPALSTALVTFLGIGAIALARKSKRMPALAPKIA